VNKKIGKRRKGKNTNSPIVSQLSTPPIAAPQTQGLLATLKEHPVFVAVSLVLWFLVAAATIVPALGYAEEKWHETIASVDFSGEIDQKKPFSIPLVVKNPSAIFPMHMPRVSCWVDVEYVGTDPKKNRALIAADQGPSGGLAIDPGKTENYLCSMPDNLTLHEGPNATGPIMPIKQADMLITVKYETWVPLAIPRHFVTQFVMFQTTEGFRWIKGNWIGRQGIVWPPGSEPPWKADKPKPN